MTQGRQQPAGREPAVPSQLSIDFSPYLKCCEFHLFRGRLVYFSWLPPVAPIWGFTVMPARARSRSRVHTGSCRSFFYQVFSQHSVCMCLMAGLYCIVLYSLHGSVAYVLCVLTLNFVMKNSRNT